MNYWNNPVVIATLILAFVTVLLALAAFLAIWQNRSVQRRERRERILNEIIDWSVDNIKATYGQDITLVSLKDDELRSAIYLGFVLVNIRSQYIKKAASIFNNNISKLVNETVEVLESCESLHAEWVSCNANEQEQKEKETLYVCKSLRKKAKAVIEETTKIKTADIA